MCFRLSLTLLAFSSLSHSSHAGSDSENAFDFFVEAYGAKYDKEVGRLIERRDRLRSFYDFPAEH